MNKIDLSDVNPKDRLGVKKVPLGLLSLAGKVVWAMAQWVGADKYGRDNWREKPVLMSIYLEAADRHIAAMRAGEDFDPDSEINIGGKIIRTAHSGHVMACMAIIEDARAAGCLIDDRSAHDGGLAVMRLYTAADYKKSEEETRKSKTPCKTLGELCGNAFSPTLTELFEDSQAHALRPSHAYRKRARKKGGRKRAHKKGGRK